MSNAEEGLNTESEALRVKEEKARVTIAVDLPHPERVRRSLTWRAYPDDH